MHGIVCGARNFFAGDKVVVTLPGSVLPGPFPIAARKTYGHVSDGMIASAKELGLGDEHSGILRLVELGIDAPVGTDAIALLGLDDVAVDINVTPDRGYALSMRGVAREYSHATGAAFRDPGSGPSTRSGRAPASRSPSTTRRPIRGRVGASEFVARIVRDVDPDPADAAVDDRPADARRHPLARHPDRHHELRDARARPADPRLRPRSPAAAASRCAARRAGETLETLDGKVRTLDAEDLLITDESGPIGLAGVMGGGTTEMGHGTRNVLIEAATFDPVSIARTARRHKLPSEASRRFERGVDPAIPFVAARRVADLMVEYAGGTHDDAARWRAVRRDRRARGSRCPPASSRVSIGVDYTPEQIAGALRLIGADLDERPEGWIVTAPTWRPDLTDKWTLAEEVARIEGYDRIPSVLPLPPSGRGLTAAQQGRRRVANALAAAGLRRDAVVRRSRPRSRTTCTARRRASTLPSIKLANPLDGQSPFLRRSLIPGLLEIAHRNVSRGFTDLALFEVGAVFLPEPGVDLRHAVRPAAGRATGCRDPRRAGCLDPAAAPPCRGAAGRQPRRQAARARRRRRRTRRCAGCRPHDRRGRRGRDRRRAGRARGAPPRAHRCAVGASRSTVEVGYVGELLPAVAEASDLPGRVIVAELDLDLVLSLAAPKRRRAVAVGLPRGDAGRLARRRRRRARRRGARGARRRRRRAARVAAARRRLSRCGRRRWREEPDVRAAVPCARPHADGCRGDRRRSSAGSRWRPAASARRCGSGPAGSRRRAPHPGLRSVSAVPGRQRGARCSSAASRRNSTASGRQPCSADGGTGCRGRHPSAGMGMTDVLILGGTGWLSGRVAARWLESGAAVTCLARGGRPAPTARRCRRRPCRARTRTTRSRRRTGTRSSTSPRSPSTSPRPSTRSRPRARHWTYVSSLSVYATRCRARRRRDAPTVHEPAVAGRGVRLRPREVGGRGIRPRRARRSRRDRAARAHRRSGRPDRPVRLLGRPVRAGGRRARARADARGSVARR